MLGIYTIATCLALVILQEVFRRSRILTLLVFGLLPPVIVVAMLIMGYLDWFKLAKIVSVPLGIMLIWFCRYTSFGEKRLGFVLIHCVLLINIMEAVVKDLTTAIQAGVVDLKLISCGLTASSGVMLIFSLALPRTAQNFVNTPSLKQIAFIDVKSPTRDFCYGSMPLSWIIAYTAWHLSFIYLNFPEDIFMHLGLHGAALFVGLRRPELWLQTRALSLGIFLIAAYSFHQHLGPFKASQSLLVELAFGLSLISLLISIAHILRKRFFIKMAQ